MRQIAKALAVGVLAVSLAVPRPAASQPASALAAQDRNAVQDCLSLAKKHRTERAVKPGFPEGAKPGAAARLNAAVADADAVTESCIGVVNLPCQEEPGGYSTAGMIDCANRELSVWDERLNRAYGKALDGDAKTRGPLRQTQRAWIAYRDAKCALPALENEGGSIVGPLTIACLLEETARQALWLEEP